MPRVGIRAYICVIYHYNFDSRHKKKNYDKQTRQRLSVVQYQMIILKEATCKKIQFS